MAVLGCGDTDTDDADTDTDGDCLLMTEEWDDNGLNSSTTYT